MQERDWGSYLAWELLISQLPCCLHGGGRSPPDSASVPVAGDEHGQHPPYVLWRSADERAARALGARQLHACHDLSESEP